MSQELSGKICTLLLYTVSAHLAELGIVTSLLGLVAGGVSYRSMGRPREIPMRRT
jgi:hypothetical protein